MNAVLKESIDGVFVIGVNHKHLSVSERSKFSLSVHDQSHLTVVFKNYGFDAVIILNTCNRTEFYGHGDMLLCKQIITQFYSKREHVSTTHFIHYQSEKAVHHMLSVVVGLESQMLGDIDILGQFKKAVKEAKKNKLLSGYLERLSNSATQAAKEARTTTQISNGSVSLSYAAIKFLKKLGLSGQEHILLIGLGKFGKSIAQNMKEYLPNCQVTLTNRTYGKAQDLACQLGHQSLHMSEALHNLQYFDVVISSVHAADSYLITKKHVKDLNSQMIFLDLSVPMSIDPFIHEFNHASVFGLEDLTKEIETTIDDRRKEIPFVKAIVSKISKEFIVWSAMFDSSESLQFWQNQVYELGQKCSQYSGLDHTTKKVVLGQQISEFVRFLKQNSVLCRDKNSVVKAFIDERNEFAYEGVRGAEGVVKKIKCKVCTGNC